MKGLCRTAVGLILFCFFLTVWPRLAAAQAGEITGVIVDATGGVLPGATVTLSGGQSGTSLSCRAGRPA